MATVEKEFKESGWSENTTPEELKSIYRTLCMKHHPDRGGSNERFHEISKFYQTALVKIKLAKCTVCSGTGKLDFSGFITTKLNCHKCKGSGLKNS
jgi:DnaJ-class molecular chaperone